MDHQTNPSIPARPIAGIVALSTLLLLLAGCATGQVPNQGTPYQVEVRAEIVPEAVPGSTPGSDSQGPPPEIISEWTVGFGDVAVGRHGGTLRVEIFEAPSTFNPAMFMGLETDAQLLQMLFSPLVEVHPHLGVLKGNLAENWTFSDDGHSVELTLRDGLRWSDGEPLTVDDVVYSYNQLYLNPEVGGIGVEIAERIGGITVARTGGRSVRISSGLPGRELLRLLAYQPLPRHVVEPWLETREPADFVNFWIFYDDLTRHVGSGPFVLLSYRDSEILESGGRSYPCAVVQLERNPFYHLTDAVGQKLPYLDSVSLIARENPYVPSTLYWDGLVDVTYLPIGSPDGEILGRQRASTLDISRAAGMQIPGQHYLVTDSATFVDSFIAVNMQRAPGPNGAGLDSPVSDWFNDVRFRRALSHLVPRERIVRELHDGNGVPAYSRIPPGLRSYAAEADPIVPRYDPAAAHILLEEMGLVDRDGDGIREDLNGTPVAFVMGTNEGNGYREDLLAILVDVLRAAGLDVTPKPTDFQELVSTVFGGTYQALLLGLGGSDSIGEGWNVWASDGDTHLWDIGQASPQRMWEERLDRLYDEWKVTVRAERLLEIENQVQLILAEELPLISVTRWYDYILMRRPYRNFRLVGLFRDLLPLEYVFIDK